MHSRPKSLQASARDAPHCPAPGLGGKPLGAGDLVEVGLGHRSVHLVAPCRASAFVFVVNVSRGLECAFEANRAQEGGGPPQSINLADFLRDLNPALGTNLLSYKVLGKNSEQRVGCNGLSGARVQRRGHGFGEIRQQVVPVCRDIGLRQGKADRLARHSSSSRSRRHKHAVVVRRAKISPRFKGQSVDRRQGPYPRTA